MTKRSFAFLVNPLSGGGAAPAAVVPVARILRDAGAEVDVTYSPGPRETVALVEEAVRRDAVVVSVGGDGMLSSVAGKVASLGGTLGLVPAGRGNDFVRMLRLSHDPAEVAAVLLRGEPTPTDLLGVRLNDGNHRVVVSSVYAGVDAVGAAMADRVRWMPDKLQYPYAALHSLATYKPVDAHVVIDGQAHDFRAATVVIANSAYYGSGMKIAPPAAVHDGLLDVVVIEAASRRELIRSLPKVYDGTHVGLPEVHLFQGRQVAISSTPGALMGGDGEPLGYLSSDRDVPVAIDVMPGAIEILLPASRKTCQGLGSAAATGPATSGARPVSQAR